MTTQFFGKNQCTILCGRGRCFCQLLVFAGFRQHNEMCPQRATSRHKYVHVVLRSVKHSSLPSLPLFACVIFISEAPHTPEDWFLVTNCTISRQTLCCLVQYRAGCFVKELTWLILIPVTRLVLVFVQHLFSKLLSN